MTDHSKTSQDLRTLIASNIAHARDYAEHEGFMVSTVCLQPEQADIVIAALSPSPNGTEASRGVGAEAFRPIGTHPRDEKPVRLLRRNGEVVAAYWSQHPMASGGDKFYPWVYLDETNGVNGLVEDAVVGWLPLAATPTPTVSPPDSTGQGDSLEWAVERWKSEVQNRPLRNVHRRALDTTWRQVIRRFGGNPEALVGPSHDDLANSLTPSQADAQTQEGGE